MENTVDPADFIIIYDVVCFVLIQYVLYFIVKGQRSVMDHDCSVRLSNKVDFTLNLKLEGTKCKFFLFSFFCTVIR